MRFPRRPVLRPLLRVVLAVVSHPWWALGGAAVVLVVGVGLAATRLGISTDQNKLFDPDVPFFRDYLRFNALFPENEAIYVLVEAKDPGRPPAVRRWAGLAD